MRVIECSAYIAAPIAGMTLAQYGADVIRVDPIGGGIDYGRLPLKPGGRSLYWTGLNKGKRSVAVNLRRPEGRELVQALAVAGGDEGGLLLTNLTWDGLSHAELAARRDDVITCTIRYRAREDIAVIVASWCAARRLEDIARLFDEHRVCWGLYRTVRDLVAHDPRVAVAAGIAGARDDSLFELLETPGVGRHRAAGTPVRIPGEPRGATAPAPLLGQHTDEVLEGVLGLDVASVGRLRDAGIVAGAECDPTAAQLGS